MNPVLSTIAALLVLTLQNPQAAARRIIDLPFSVAERWQVLALVVVLGVLAGHATQGLLPPDPSNPFAGLIASPLRLGLVEAGSLLVIVLATHLVGRFMGGQGALEDTVIAVAWIQLVMVCLQVAQLVIAVVSVGVAGLFGLLGLAIFLWLLTQFVTVLHGFRSPAKVFMMVLLTFFLLAFLSVVVLSMAGITISARPPEAASDV